MRKPIQLYDEKGVPLCDGDLIRVYHFRTRTKKYWMYKRVFLDNGFFMAEHYPFGTAEPKGLKNCYCLQGHIHDTHLEGVTVVASRTACYEDRKRVKANRFNTPHSCGVR